MGVDAVILFQATGDTEGLCLDSCVTIREASEYKKEDNAGATHEACVPWRYYGPHYARGHWPSIAAVLMELLQHPNISKVWYGGDSTSCLPEIAAARILELSEYYMQHGSRPYYDREYEARMSSGNSTDVK